MTTRTLDRRRFALGASTLSFAFAFGGACKKDPPKEGTIQLQSAAVTAATMPQRPLGKTGVNVSMVGLGGYHLGLVKDESESIRIVRTALDRGVTFLDNSWDYHEGKSEERMGKALKDGYRQKAFLMTKVDGRTKKDAAIQIDQSLKRLGTDMIDLVQIHEVIRMSDPGLCFKEGGCIEALLEAKKAGKLRFIGFTGHKDPSIHLEMIRTADAHQFSFSEQFSFDTVQMPLNVMDAHFRSFTNLVLPVAQQKGMGILGMKSMGSGKILESKKVTAIECLHYAMNLPTSVVITGCDSMGVLEQAVSAALTFRPLAPETVKNILDRTRDVAKDGKYEVFKTTGEHDSTAKHPEWMDSTT